MIVKVVSLFAVIAAVQGGGLYETALHNTGVSSNSRQQDSHENYAFAYDIVDGLGASNSRSEIGDVYGNKKGFYTLQDIDGRARRVDYVADDYGFRVSVNSNEPGTAHSAPADAIVTSPYAGPVAQSVVTPVAHEAPVDVAQLYPVAIAPVSYATKSVVSHVNPAATVARATPFALTHTDSHALEHAVPITHVAPLAYSTKSVVSHDAPVAVKFAAPVSIGHSSPFITHPNPLAYSTKSVISHATPITTVAHSAPLAVAHGVPSYFSSKSVISPVAPVSSHYASGPVAISRYGSIYNKGIGLGALSYGHGLLGHHLGGLAYNNKIYGQGLLGHGVRGYYNKGYDHNLRGYGYGLGGQGLRRFNYGNGNGNGLLGHRLGGLTYNNGYYGYGGLKSIHY